MAVDGTFSPVPPGEKGRAVGPGSNTGQKGALVDYLTIVLSERVLEERGLTDPRNLLATLFGFRGEVVNTAIKDRRWQFYKRSASLIDRDGEQVGKIGFDGNGGTVCVSLSGAGTRWVSSWERTAIQLRHCEARITRCDLAFDDYEGERLNTHAMRAQAQNREFMQGGTPPKWRFLDDDGNGTGCTLYVGSKGHKELCVYEKGKQLGMPDSPWVRAEVRLYGKHCEVPIDVLTDPLAFLRGAYDVLGQLLLDVAPDACTRIKTKRKSVEVSGEALVEYLRRQVGPSLNLLLEAFGGSWEDFMQHRIVREGSPGRFRGIAKGEQLAQMLREELCRSAQ